VPRKLPTQSQLDQIAASARFIARMRIPNPNPLKCPVVAALIDTGEIDVLAVITYWEINYKLASNLDRTTTIAIDRLDDHSKID
jgi:hypothetical protein